MATRCQDGFTMIEMLISISLLTIALMSLSSVSVIAMKGNEFSQTMNNATVMAVDKMESLKNLSYDNIASGGPETLQTIYTRQWTVSNDSPVAGTKTIVVTVSWSSLGITRNVRLRTIVTR